MNRSETPLPDLMDETPLPCSDCKRPLTVTDLYLNGEGGFVSCFECDTPAIEVTTEQMLSGEW